MEQASSTFSTKVNEVQQVAEQIEPNRSTPAWVPWLRFLYSRARIRRGLGRAVKMVAARHRAWHLVPVPMSDGRILQLDLRETMSLQYLLVGKIFAEDGETRLVRSMIRPGDVALDIGANVGWYTTLLAEAVGCSGRVFAFEPNPAALRMVEAAAAAYPCCEVLPMAVGRECGTAELHIPLDGVFASLRDLTMATRKVTCETISIDTFLDRRGRPPVTFIKCDAEGAELDILRGAVRTLADDRPPLLMFEISEFTASRFGYSPREIGEFIVRTNGTYTAFHIDPHSGLLRPLGNSFDNKSDAVFVPKWLSGRVSEFVTDGMPTL